jgi:hypothetical protein
MIMADKYGLEHFSYKSSLQAETSESAQAINLKGQAAARVPGWWKEAFGTYSGAISQADVAMPTCVDLASKREGG